MPIKRKLPWIRVTNEYTATFADKDCIICDGEGYVGDSRSGFTVCVCAVNGFRKEMIDTGKVRQRSQLIKQNGVTREVTWQEYRAMGEVE